jgi:hypothetical protein
MYTKRLAKFAIACLLVLSPLAAEAASPSLYGLSKRAGGADEVLTYDLNQDRSLSIFYEPNTIGPLDESGLGPDTIASIAVSGNNLYGLSKRAGGADEVLTYDLNQDRSLSIFYEPNTIGPLDESGLGPDTIASIATDGTPSSGGGGGATPVPEPSTYALMMLGVLALATLKGCYLRPVWSRA